ncbi:beta-galactosidase [Silvibacterium dinghuense]|uniref:Beta-galactosidase n=1 Tax=Silvibacterium dinghuense TaxID=1560006 RepID=A0A4Q1SE21_9BACT|nr:beta-galactosidase [Silvibacterium dinghuense]RXS95357.1 beta-galactosidase [Silvibacterium dinghuense]GGH12640.1 beta-galactosidase [Silvibacterium dinghuense]
MNRREFLAAGSAGAVTFFSAHHLAALSAAAPATSPIVPPMLFGVDYYPDQTPEHLWEEDAAAMAAAGVTNVRIAEFAWGLMEPSEGTYDFRWLDRAVSILHAHNIGCILGTPSAAPPPWLTQKYPEVLMVNDKGVTLAPGTRRFTCPTNATYRRLSVNIATEMAKHFASTPGVIGWQIDNELTLGDSARCYCRWCREGFQQWLRKRYPSLEAINQAWGTVFWSNTYTDFSQIPVPLPSGAPPNPGFALDYYRYQSDANASFLDEQLTVLRRLCPQHFMTTNNAGLVDNLNLRDLYRNLDFASADNYPSFFAIILADSGTSLPPEAIAALAALGHDSARGLKDGKPFFIMEEQSGKAGQPFFTPQPEPGQLRLWSYQAVAHGAFGINYFRWDTAVFGAEEYWHGLLRHDRSHSPGFDEIVQTIRELKTLGPEALHASCDAGLGLLYDLSSDWALGFQPGQPKLKYLGELTSWYGSLAAAGRGVDILDGTEDLSRYKAVFAPLSYIVSAQQAERIRAYVQGGGLFFSGVRLGVKDEHSRMVETPLPGLLRDVMGVELEDYQPIYTETQNVKFSGPLTAPDAPVHLWADILEPKTAEVLATYTGGAYAGRAAITANRFGQGHAVYLGAHLEAPELARVLMTLLTAHGIPRAFDAPRGVEITSRSVGQNSWTYFLNHAPQPQQVPLAMSYQDAFDSTSVSGSFSLPGYGVRVLRSTPRNG